MRRPNLSARRGRVCAIDVSPDQIAAAQQRCAELAWIECRVADITSPPYGDAEFDAVFAVQVLEYLAGIDGGAAPDPPDTTAGRAARYCGDGLEFRGVAFRERAADAARADRMGAAYAVPESAGHPGGTLRRAGIQPLRQTAIPILNTSYNPACFSYWVARAIRPFVVSRQGVTDEEAAEWLDEFAKLEESRAYFFSLTPILTEAVKVA
jgi:SAM-dependent methyltransferase